MTVERHFYGRAPDVGVDDAQTEKENKLSALVNEVRETSAVPAGAEPVIAELIVNLGVRTRYFRKAVTGMAEAVFGHLHEKLSDFEEVRRLLRSRTDEMIERIALKLGIADVGRLPHANRAKLRSIVEGAIAETTPVELLRIADSVYRDAMGTLTPEFVQQSHLTPLRASVAPPIRVANCQAFEWSVISAPAGSLILGDMGPLCVDGSSGKWKPYVTTDQDMIAALALPISDRHLLVGSNGPCSVAERISSDLEPLNVASSELSCDLFVSSRFTQREKGYACRLGARFPELWNELLPGLQL